jgi:3-hydroxyisobutyrate dehydrogenase-like beta-hydroxyacid dehydrogenase
MKIGFVGLGNMGGPMAANLIAAGHEVKVHDLSRAAAARHLDHGAEWADSPAAAAEGAEVVCTSLPGPPQVDLVSRGPNGLMETLAEGSVYFDLSTCSPTFVRELASDWAERGVTMFDSPVSGGPEGAESKKLAIYVGGDEAVFDSYRALLLDISDQPEYIGPAGAGTVVKLVHNLTAFQLDCAFAEMFTLGVKAGVEPEALWKGLKASYLGRRKTFDGLPAQFLVGEFDEVVFSLALAHKDVKLATDLAREHEVPTRMADLTFAELSEAMNRGWAGRDCRAAMLLQEERANVEVAIPRERLDD